MRRVLSSLALAPIGALLISLAAIAPAAAQQTSTAPNLPAPHEEPFDVNSLFAATCGWCHSDGGRAAGKGPQLMNTQHDDDYLRSRIATGKPGAMPAFGEVFDADQIEAIVRYIHALKPEQG
jgi:mono/diheme cytochrome c family protein